MGVRIKASLALYFGISSAVFFFAWPSSALNYVKSPLSVTTYYSMYDDITLGTASEKVRLQNAVTLEVAVRIQSVFNFTLTADNFFKDDDPLDAATAKKEMKAYGIGLKVDLPGIFLLKSTRTDSSRYGKLHPVNTFIFGALKQFNTVEPGGDNSVIYSNTYGLGMDIYLFNKVSYLSLIISILNHGGDNYGQMGGGLGVNF